MVRRCDSVFYRPSLFSLAALLIVAGCSLNPEPKWRIGSAPYPRTNGYLDALDPAALGPHRYDSFLPYFDREKSRGIVYTCRGGFIDLSHTRHVSDWSRYVALRLRGALRRQDDHFYMAGSDHSTLEFRIRYPDWWKSLAARERRDLIDALALRLGQRTAYALQTYHEAQTWYGYRYIPFFDEWDSAFCYDDMISHVVGAQMAGVALDDGRNLGMRQSEYNRAIEAAYAAEMKRLAGVEPKRTWAAIYAVEGKWWGQGVPVKRQVDAGFGDDRLEAWTIPGFNCGHTACAAGTIEPLEFPLPTLAEVRGRDMSGFADVYIRPGLFQRGRMVRALGEPGRRIHIERDLPRLIEIIAADARRRLGEEAVSRPSQDWRGAMSGTTTRSTTRPAAGP